MVATSGGGEANELIDEVARSEVNEMGDAMAAVRSGGEASELIDEAAVQDDEPRRRRVRSKKSGGARRITKRGTTDGQDDG